jgi:hypothetical protein
MSILSTEAGTGEIGGADEGFFAIDDDGFGVNARAKNSFKLVAIDQIRISVNVCSETWSWLFGMHQANANAIIDQIRKLQRQE